MEIGRLMKYIKNVLILCDYFGENMYNSVTVIQDVTYTRSSYYNILIVTLQWSNTTLSYSLCFMKEAHEVVRHATCYLESL